MNIYLGDDWEKHTSVYPTGTDEVCGEKRRFVLSLQKNIPTREREGVSTPVDTYIGVITSEGVIQSSKRKLSLTDAEVWEYRFSKAVWELRPDDWKNRWEVIGRMYFPLFF